MAKRNLMAVIGAASVMAATSSETLGSDLEAFDVQIDMNNQRDLEDALAADVDTFVTGVDAIDESEDRIQTLEEGIDTMPTEALVGGVAQLEVVAGQVDDMTDSVPSLEALSSDVREATRRSIEAIGEKLKAAWTTLKEFGVSVIGKIKGMFDSFLTWIGDSSKKADALLKLIETKDKLKENVDLEKLYVKIGGKLTAASAIVGNEWSIAAPTKMTKLYTELRNVTDKSGNALSSALVKNLETNFDSVPAIGTDEYVLVSSIHGKRVSFAEMGKLGDVVGIKSIRDASVSNTAVAKLKITEVSSLADIKSALEYVKELGTIGKTAKTELQKLVAEVEIDLKSEVDAVKYKGSMPVLSYLLSATAMAAGGVILAPIVAAASSMAVPVAVFGGSLSAIGAAAGSGAASAIAAPLTAANIGALGVQTAANIVNGIVISKDPKQFDKLAASDKVRYVKNKSRFITWYTKGILAGINNLGKEIVDSAKIMLDQYEGKSAAPAAEAE